MTKTATGFVIIYQNLFLNLEDLFSNTEFNDLRRLK
jgi:hypothetical protein